MSRGPGEYQSREQEGYLFREIALLFSGEWNWLVCTLSWVSKAILFLKNLNLVYFSSRWHR